MIFRPFRNTIDECQQTLKSPHPKVRDNAHVLTLIEKPAASVAHVHLYVSLLIIDNFQLYSLNSNCN